MVRPCLPVRGESAEPKGGARVGWDGRSPSSWVSRRLVSAWPGPAVALALSLVLPPLLALLALPVLLAMPALPALLLLLLLLQ